MKEYFDRDVTELLVVNRSDGVANRADPTAWERLEIKVLEPFCRPALLDVTLTDSWCLVVDIRVLGCWHLFLSESIHSRLWRPINWAWRRAQMRAFEREYEDYEPDYDTHCYPN